MSISFSGLASGLDTSSWVESLTALKRAKVETYQAEKEKLVLTQQTLASIKNFFNSFRSVIEKVTDSRLCVGGSLDLFAQNLATSSKANILTATATSEAQEGIYNIKVDNLATNTQASSNYSYITTQTVSSTATLGSTLGSLGVRAGKIGVTVNGIERNVKIGNDETIQSFIEKLNNIGAKANYNEATGIFNLNVSSNDIRDIDNTGIVNALHLKGVNEGYTSNVLQKPITETVVETATVNTKLSELGIKSGVLTFSIGGIDVPANIDSNMTLGNFMNINNLAPFNMNLSEDGILSIDIDKGTIIDDGGTGLLKAFGWSNPEITDCTQTSNKLQYSTTITEGSVANRNTLLKDIATVNNGDTIVVKNSANVTKTITLSQTSTIGNVIDSLNSVGLYATMSSDGVVSISDGTIVGGTFDVAAAFNLESQTSSSSVASKPIYAYKTVAQDVTSTANITHTVVRDIQLTDNVVDFCPELSETGVYLKDNNVSDEHHHLKTFRIEDYYTFQDLFKDLKSMGVEAKLENGVITITPPEGTYVTGLEPLGINVISNSSSSTVTVATTKTSGTLYYTSTVTATGSSKVSYFVSSTSINGQIYDMSAHNTYNINVGDKTFNQLFQELANHGITASMNDGVISLSSNNGSYVSGTLFEQLGIQTISSGSTVTKGAALTSTAKVEYTVTSTIYKSTTDSYTAKSVTGSRLETQTSRAVSTTIQGTDTLYSLFGAEFIGDGLIYVHYLKQDNKLATTDIAEPTIPGSKPGISGSTIKTLEVNGTAMVDVISIDNTTTVDQFISKVQLATGAAVKGRISSSGTSINFYGTTDYNFSYFSHSMLRESEVRPGQTTEKRWHSLTPNVTTVQILYTTLSSNTNWRDLSLYKLSKLGSLLDEYNIELISRNGEKTTLTLTGGTTLGTIADKLSEYGLRMSVDSNCCIKIIPFSSIFDSTNYAISNMSDALKKMLKLEGRIGENLSYTYTEGSVTPEITLSTTFITANTTFKNLGLSGIRNITVVQNGTEKTLTINPDNTIQNLISMLRGVGIQAAVGDCAPDAPIYHSQGQFAIYASDTSYIKSIDGELRDVLKLGSASTYRTEGGTTYSNTSSKKLEKVTTSTLDIDTTLSYGAMTIYDHGEIRTVNAYGRDFNDFLIEMEDYGITATLNNGVASFSSTDPNNVYILDFGGAFGLYGKGYTTKNQSSDSYHNTSSNRLQKEETVNATWDTTMGELGFNTDGLFRIANKDSAGTTNINISSEDTLRDVREKLAMHNIAMDLSNGKVTLKGLNGAYIEGMSSSVRDALKLENKNAYTQVKELINDYDSANVIWEDLYLANGTNFDNSAGKFYLYVNGTRYQLEGLHSNDTLDTFRSELEKYGVTTTLKNGVLTLSAQGDVYITTEGITSEHGWGAATGITQLGIGQDSWKRNTSYKSSEAIGVTHSSTSTVGANRDTKLSDLGVTTGEYLLYQNGVKHTMFVSSDDTLGDFINTLRTYGIEANLVTNGNSTTIKTHSDSNSYIAASNTSEKSNIIDKLFGSNNVIQSNRYSGKPEIERTETHQVSVDEDTKLADISTNFIKPGEKLQITINDETVALNISADETVGSLIDKFNSVGLNASLTDGKFVIQSGFNSLNISGTSALTYNSDLGGFCSTDPTRPVISTEVIVEQHDKSAANYADYNTKLGLLNISSGTLNIYRNGEKAEIIVDSEQTFGDLKSKISAKFSDVTLSFDNGKLKISSTKGNVVVGTTTDSSNFAAITGISTNGNGDAVSSRALYRVNNSSKVTTSGLFVRGNVTEGSFIVGDTKITIDKDTTIDDIISQINYNDKCQATAYWDSIDGKFVIKSKKSGASMINIEAGTSTFTDIMGLTSTKDGKKVMNTEAQELGKNAVFSINGTRFTSTSNTVGSDISRIQGVTINLKDVTDGETVTLTIEKDKETVANAMSDIVDAYNELIENVDKEVARGANLSGESTLKLIRNQIRSLMTSSISNSGQFKNLASIGIKLSAASSGNIRTDNIHTLSFDKDKFMESFGADLSSLKSLLVGTQDSKGILTQVEDVLEQALGGVTGYFASTEKSYNNKISRLDDKIEKADKAADRYKMRLEAKFKTMDMLISKYQNNYSSFLG